MGNIEDPDEEMNMRREEADSQPVEGAQRQQVTERVSLFL